MCVCLFAIRLVVFTALKRKEKKERGKEKERGTNKLRKKERDFNLAIVKPRFFEFNKDRISFHISFLGQIDFSIIEPCDHERFHSGSSTFHFSLSLSLSLSFARFKTLSENQKQQKQGEKLCFSFRPLKTRN